MVPGRENKQYSARAERVLTKKKKKTKTGEIQDAHGVQGHISCHQAVLSFKGSGPPEERGQPAEDPEAAGP